jgi:transcriptional regulator with XRE-family HTH domain
MTMIPQSMSCLRKARILSCSRAADVARQLGVPVATFKRWERGAPIPEKHLAQLAEMLGVSQTYLAGSPQDFMRYTHASDQALVFWGTAAIRFHGSDSTLLLPLSCSEADRFERLLGSTEAFIRVHTLDNRCVIVRRGSIADVHVASDACDEFGPDDYARVVIDEDDATWWALSELRLALEGALDDVSASWLEPQVKAFLADYEAGDDKHRRRIDACVARATCVEWQLRGGVKRSREDVEPGDAELFAGRMESDLDDGEMIDLTIVPRHDVVWLNPSNLDYVSLPLHIVNYGMLLSSAELVDEVIDEV